MARWTSSPDSLSSATPAVSSTNPFGTGGGNGFTAFRDQIMPADPSYDWQQGLAKRGIANTYV